MGVLAASHAIPTDVSLDPPLNRRHLETGIIKATQSFGQESNYQESNHQESNHQCNSQLRRPMICEGEVHDLARKYGSPVRRTYHIQADEYIRAYRWRSDLDRRAEVVFAIRCPNGLIWLHGKAHYPDHIYRLPSGGIEWDEGVEQALLREVEEETSLSVGIERFCGIITYKFHHHRMESTAQFASYVFLLRCGYDRVPVCQGEENISCFRAIMPSQLLELSTDLRNMIGGRRGWGQWRALAHDMVYQAIHSKNLDKIQCVMQ
ncbi:MAG: NUDIX hydrolase [Chloroflexota bacterium]